MTNHRDAHLRSDVDSDQKALHHTLGYGHNQAAPGVKLRALEKKVAEVEEEEIAALGARLATTEGNLSSLGTSLATLEGRLATAEGTLSLLGGIIVNVLDRVTALENP